MTSLFNRLTGGIAVGLALMLPAAALADRDDRNRDNRHSQWEYGRYGKQGERYDHRHNDRRGPPSRWEQGQRTPPHSHYHYPPPPRPRVVYAPPPIIIVPKPTYRLPPYPQARHHRHSGYGRYRSDADAYPWIGLAGLTIGLLDVLTEPQLRSLESAHINATTERIGQPVYWNDGGISGSVVAVRDGRSANNQYCREFQQIVAIGNQREQAYGVACRQPDGAWKIIDQRGF